MRLTSEFYVSQLMRKAQRDGFATLVKRGSEQAGAIYIVLRFSDGNIRFYAPAPQHFYENDTQDRYFYLISTIISEQDVTVFIESESKFDPDFWVVELEQRDNQPLSFEVVD